MLRRPPSLAALLLISGACKDDVADDSAPVVDDSGPVGTDDSANDSADDSDAPEELCFDLLLAAANDQEVHRIFFPEDWRDRSPEELEAIWTWSLPETFEDSPLKPHGLHLVDDTLWVASFDYFVDAAVVTLDVHSGEVQDVIRATTGERWGGLPALDSARFTHNVVVDGDTLIASDTHNHRVVGMDRDWAYQWEISQDTLTDPYLRLAFAGPNDVELVEIEGEERLLVSARGDNFNHVLLFERAEPRRPGDAPWAPIFRFPDADSVSALHENHNPRVVDGGFRVSDSANDRIRWVGWDGEVDRTLPEPDCEGESPLHWPRDAVKAPDGSLLIADTHNDRVVAVDPSGACLGEDAVLWELTGVDEPYQVEVLPHEGSCGEGL